MWIRGGETAQRGSRALKTLGAPVAEASGAAKMPAKERSAALPSREGAAALLGVLAGCLGGMRRNYRRRASFCAGAANRRHPRKSFRVVILLHRFFTQPRRCRTFPGTFPNAGRLPNAWLCKLCLFLALPTPAKCVAASMRDSVPSRNSAAGAKCRRMEPLSLANGVLVFWKVGVKRLRRRCFREHAFHGRHVLSSGTNWSGRFPIFARRANGSPGRAQAHAGCAACLPR
jgi:hypothetical protein